MTDTLVAEDFPFRHFFGTRRFRLDLKVNLQGVAALRQIHGGRIIRVEEPTGDQPPEGDGLVTSVPGLLLAVSTADCVPLLLADPVRRAVGAVHAGWRGCAKGISTAAIEAFRREFESDPRDLAAAIGPAAGVCCYEVGDEVVREVGAGCDLSGLAFRSGRKWKIDLKGIVRRQLFKVGVGKISLLEHCTICRPDLFYSYRSSKASVRGRRNEASPVEGATPGVPERYALGAEAPMMISGIRM